MKASSIYFDLVHENKNGKSLYICQVSEIQCGDNTIPFNQCNQWAHCKCAQVDGELEFWQMNDVKYFCPECALDKDGQFDFLKALMS